MPDEVRVREVGFQKTHPAESGRQVGQRDGEPEVHEDELHVVGVHDRAHPPAEGVRRGKEGPDEHRGHELPSEDQLEQDPDHEDVGCGGRKDLDDPRAQEGRGSAVGPVQLVRHGVELGASRAAREEDREERRADVIGNAEHDPVGDAVPVRVLPHPEHASVPGRDERGHEGGQGQRAPHEEILHRTAPRDSEEPHAHVDQKRRVEPEEGEIGGVERASQNSAFRLTKKLRVAAG